MGRILPFLSTNERNIKMVREKQQQQLNSEGTVFVLTCPVMTFFLFKPIVKNNSRKSWLSISKQDTFPRFPASWHSQPKPLIIL